MNKLNQCLSGDADSIEMYILPEARERSEVRSGGGTYQSTCDFSTDHTADPTGATVGSIEKLTERYTRLTGDTAPHNGLGMTEGSNRGSTSRVGPYQGDRRDPQPPGVEEEEEEVYCSYCGIHLSRLTPRSFRVLILVALSASAFVQVDTYLLTVQVYICCKCFYMQLSQGFSLKSSLF